MPSIEDYVDIANRLVREQHGEDRDMFDLTPLERSEICEEAARIVEENIQERGELRIEELRCKALDL